MSHYSAGVSLGVQGIKTEIRTKRSNRFKNLPRIFGRHELSKYWIFRNADIEVNPGDVIAVLGPDPLMCTTMMRCMCALLPADEGAVQGDPRSIMVTDPKGRATRLLSQRQCVFMLAGLYGMTDREASERFDDIVQMAGIKATLHQTVNESPPAIKVQIAISVAMFAPVDILAFDGTAMGGRKTFSRHAITRLNTVRDRGQAILLRTEDIALINAMANKAIILDAEQSQTVSVAEAIEYLKAGKQLNNNPADVKPEFDEDEDDEAMGI